tara:strand:- start:25153 stop:26172 length:1020 start_codon:yes stop_codon:yes gene_type:complete
MADLLKEAIADAKAVRQTAIANAKLALEEAFTPKLQSMLAARINEQEDMMDDEEEEEGTEMETSPEVDAAIDDAESIELGDEEVEDEDEDAGEEDLELESIIRELEDGDEDDEDEEELEEGSIESSSKIGSGTSFDDNSGATPDPSGKETGANGDSAITGSDLLEQLEDGEEDEDDEDEDVTIDEVLRSLREQDEEDEDEEEEDDSAEAVAEARYVAHAYENKLREAYSALAFMKNKINEVNLLNAKLLFSNKLFRAGNLNENQKLRVIETFDRANNLREIKLVYSTLAESFKGGSKSVAKRPITEGLASKSVASTKPRNVITEGQVQAARFQKLAGLK